MDESGKYSFQREKRPDLKIETAPVTMEDKVAHFLNDPEKVSRILPHGAQTPTDFILQQIPFVFDGMDHSVLSDEDRGALLPAIAAVILKHFPTTTQAEIMRARNVERNILEWVPSKQSE